MTEYVLIYDAANVPAVRGTDFLMLPVAVALVAAFRARRPLRRSGAPRHPLIDNAGLVTAVAVFTVFATVVMAAARYQRVTSLRERLRSGDYALVEGRVEAFVPGDRGGHRYESWRVQSDGHTWSYRYRAPDEVPGFHQGGGPIREGLRVRLADVDGYIARLEIEKGAEDVDGEP